jgi:filamentous hemagglutinin
MDEPLRLPNATAARISTEKLVRYALDPRHERGRHKARVFRVGSRDHDGGLALLARSDPPGATPEAEVRGTRITAFGVAYEVVVEIDGLNGATHPVVTTWIIESDRRPRLTSTWVDIP